MKKLKAEMKKTKKEKALRAYNKQYKQRSHKCGKQGHTPGNHKCLENKKEDKKDVKAEKSDYRKKQFDGVCYHSGRKGQLRKDFKEKKA